MYISAASVSYTDRIVYTWKVLYFFISKILRFIQNFKILFSPTPTPTPTPKTFWPIFQSYH